MRPEVRLRKPRIALASVVLPLPLSPATVVIVAGRSAMVRLRSRRATTGCVPPSRPPPYVLVAWLTCSSGAGPSTPAGASRSLAGLATSAAEATDAHTPCPAPRRISARGGRRGVSGSMAARACQHSRYNSRCVLGESRSPSGRQRYWPPGLRMVTWRILAPTRRGLGAALLGAGGLGVGGRGAGGGGRGLAERPIGTSSLVPTAMRSGSERLLA